MNLKNQKKESTAFRKFLRFSGIGVQLGVMMFLASKIGAIIDTKLHLDKPWTTLFLVVLSLVVFVMNLVRQLNKLNN